MSFQVPAVTVEDLQAFQTKHFPGAQVHPIGETNQSRVEGETQEEEEYYYYDDEEEDLGYYPDGAKRTLTDEQIRIFRHSEIHALRREKQAREEEEEQRVQDLQETSKNTDAGSKGRDGPSSGNDSKGTQLQSIKSNDTGSEMATLDYDDGPQMNSRPQQASSRTPFTGRKIVSYED